MVHEHVLIAAYGLCHPEWSFAVIQSSIKNKHNQEVSICFALVEILLT